MSGLDVRISPYTGRLVYRADTIARLDSFTICDYLTNKLEPTSIYWRDWYDAKQFNEMEILAWASSPSGATA